MPSVLAPSLPTYLPAPTPPQITPHHPKRPQSPPKRHRAAAPKMTPNHRHPPSSHKPPQTTFQIRNPPSLCVPYPPLHPRLRISTSQSPQNRRARFARTSTLTTAICRSPTPRPHPAERANEVSERGGVFSNPFSPNRPPSPTPPHLQPSPRHHPTSARIDFVPPTTGHHPKPTY